VLAGNMMYNFAGKAVRRALKHMPRKMIYNSLNVWGRDRELPEVPEMSFKEWYKKNGRNFKESQKKQ
jgi:L-lactate dehydrogenase complex protein LldF